MLVAVWQSWAVNYTSLVVTTTRLSCQTWWKPTTRPPARGLSLDDYLSQPSGTAVSAFSDSSCRRCPAPSSPLTSPSQTPSTCIGTNATKRSTISTTISTRTRTRMWTQRTEFGPVTFSACSPSFVPWVVLPHHYAEGEEAWAPSDPLDYHAVILTLIQVCWTDDDLIFVHGWRR